MLALKPRAMPSTPLAHSTLTALITDLLCEYELRHVFRNSGKKAIEAVYSFPIPLDAAFIGMQATLAGETKTAQVLPAKQASRDYDQAISAGDSAVLLEQLQPGLLCVNLGNLKPGEDGEIVLRFAAALNVADGTARFSLPLVHRPRYGRSPLDEVVEPRHDFGVEHPLDAEIRVRGLLAGCPVQCATQGVRFAQESGDLVLCLGHAQLDRDLVLNFELGHEPLGQARWIADGEGSLGIASFTLPMPTSETTAPRDICLLLDGSGSMQGDAIVQSRQALAAVTDALQEHDRIQVIRFGSSHHTLFRRPLQATARVKESLRALNHTVNADLGGTEMGTALKAALDSLVQLDGEASRKVVILVTDGAVHTQQIEDAREQALRQGIRVFVVAVGSSAGVDVLAPLAETTQGTLERAVPAEPIDAGVMRQFRRARLQPVATFVRSIADTGQSLPDGIKIMWGEDAVQLLPLGIVYPGDAVTAIARFPDQKSMFAGVMLPNEASDAWTNAWREGRRAEPWMKFSLGKLQVSPAWRAWAGQRFYLHAAAADRSERETLALRYGLITEETKAVLVKQRAEGDKIDGLPVVTPVAHMVPAGMVVADKSVTLYQKALSASCARSGVASMDYLDIPAFMRRQADDAAPKQKAAKRRPPTLAPEAKSALAQALFDLALHDGSATFGIDDLLRRVPSQWHAEVRAWCEYKGLQAFDRRKAAALLEALRNKGVAIAISDDDEAQLALIR